MREFFRGWKRKVGVVMLGFSCAFTMIWMNSLYGIQTAEFALRNSQFRMKSFQGELYCFAWDENWKDQNRSTYWSTKRLIKPVEAKQLTAQLRAQLDESRRLTGGWLILYRTIVLPLTLLSAYLLLSKPRPTKASKPDEPAPVEAP